MTRIPRLRVAVLSDFDGTLTPSCTIDTLYGRFAAPSWVEVTQRWERGEIGTREELTTNFATMKAGRAEMETVLDAVTLDPGLPALLAFCRERGYPFAIVSDGLTWYIEHILARHGLHDITTYANQISFEPQGLRISFPWYDASSPLRGVGKAAIVRRHQQQGYHVVFIGDGLSDVEAVGVADVLYAKGSLLRHCREHGVAAIEYLTLSDVIAGLKNP
jgi:2-hydroxy-3-keto-5-methylthiopentenyl-1-phosphate phosphatase